MFKQGHLWISREDGNEVWYKYFYGVWFIVFDLNKELAKRGIVK